MLVQYELANENVLLISGGNCSLYLILTSCSIFIEHQCEEKSKFKLTNYDQEDKL